MKGNIFDFKFIPTIKGWHLNRFLIEIARMRRTKLLAIFIKSLSKRRKKSNEFKHRSAVCLCLCADHHVNDVNGDDDLNDEQDENDK